MYFITEINDKQITHNNGQVVGIAFPEDLTEAKALEWFLNLSIEGQMAQITLRYKDWSRDQQKELQRVSG